MSNKQEEYEAQVAIFEWAETNLNKYPDLEFMFATLNGIRLSPGLRNKAKKQGNKKGVPDIWLPIPHAEFSGLIIELKKEKGGVVRTEQKKWLKKLSACGFYATVCKGSEEAINTIEWYLKQ